LAGRQSVMNDNLSKEFDRITDLGKVRSDEYTEKVLAFVQDMEASGPEPFIPLLADIALVRALIVHLVIRYGPERGLVEARDAFNMTFDQWSLTWYVPAVAGISCIRPAAPLFDSA
jgi:hypothetical protein